MKNNTTNTLIYKNCDRTMITYQNLNNIIYYYCKNNSYYRNKCFNKVVKN